MKLRSVASLEPARRGGAGREAQRSASLYDFFLPSSLHLSPCDQTPTITFHHGALSHRHRRPLATHAPGDPCAPRRDALVHLWPAHRSLGHSPHGSWRRGHGPPGAYFHRSQQPRRRQEGQKIHRGPHQDQSHLDQPEDKEQADTPADVEPSNRR